VRNGNIKSFVCCNRPQAEEYLHVFKFVGARIQWKISRRQPHIGKDGNAPIAGSLHPLAEKENFEIFNKSRRDRKIDILGREVLRGAVPADGLLKLDVSSLPSGLYFVTGGNWRAKFAKE
jgi:hypothetical protein